MQKMNFHKLILILIATLCGSKLCAQTEELDLTTNDILQKMLNNREERRIRDDIDFAETKFATDVMVMFSGATLAMPLYITENDFTEFLFGVGMTSIIAGAILAICHSQEYYHHQRLLEKLNSELNVHDVG